MTQEPVPLKFLVDRYLLELWPNSKTRSSVQSHFDNLIEIFPYLSGVITEADYQILVSTLREKSYKDTTINRHMNALSKLLRRALTEGYISHVPTYKRLIEKKAQLRFLSKHDEKLLFSHIRNSNELYYQFSVFLIDTGLLPSEAISLPASAFQHEYISIPESQKNESRILPLTSRVRRILNNLSFDCTSAFKHIRLPDYQNCWRKTLAGSTFPNDGSLTPMILRHTCAYRLIKSGMDIHKVQKWLGNRDYKSMLKYEHLINANNFTGFAMILENFND